MGGFNISRIIMILIMVIGVLAALFSPDNAGLIITYLLLGGAALAAIIFPVVYVIRHPGTAKRTMISFGVVIAVVLLAFVLGDGTPQAGVSEGTAKYVSTGLNTLYILFFGAIGVAIYSEVSRLFK